MATTRKGMDLRSPTKVLHVISAFHAGGAERFVVSLLLALRSTAVSMHVIALSNRTDEAGLAMQTTLSDAKVCWRSGPTRSVRTRTVLWYVGLLNELRPSIVHLHTENTYLMHLLAMPFLTRRPVVVRTLHNTVLPAKWTNRIALRSLRADMSVGCSEAATNSKRGHIRGPLSTIPNGVTFDEPIRTSEIAALRRSELRLEKAAFHFLSVGRMDGSQITVSPKAQDVLIQAWKLAQMTGHGGRLHLIGDGDLRRELEELAHGDPGILFHGIRSDVPKWLLAVDCFVMPSRSEGLPIAGIEAMGAGLPCIFSDIAPLRELRPPLAWWVKPDDCAALAERLHQCLDNPAFPEQSAVREVRQRFGINETATKYRKVYEDALARQ